MRHVLVLALLVGLVVGVRMYWPQPAATAIDVYTVLATGFILLAAYTAGELFRRARLPALLGYLTAGILFGPKLSQLLFGASTFAPLSEAVLGDLQLVNVLAVGVIGTMGGGELKVADLRQNFRKLLTITALVFVTVLPATAAAVLGFSFFAPGIVPFLAEYGWAHRLAAALLMGGLAVGMSPSATLALLQEVRAHGPFTSLVLGTVVLADLVLVATFLLLLALGRLLVSPEGVSLDGILHALPHIGAEFGWAVVLGVIVGALFIGYLRFVGREILLFSLIIVFAASLISRRLHAETLLVFLVAGFLVQNFSALGEKLLHAFEQIALPVFVIYFATQAAGLDLISVARYLPLTIFLVALRISLFWLMVRAGARLTGVDGPTRERLGMSFFSQGGVDLVLAAMVADAMPAWGVEVQTVTMATILFYVIGGPPFLARALDAAGESAAARERGAEELGTRASRIRASTTIDLERPQAEDAALNRRLERLLREVEAARQTVLEEHLRPISKRRSGMLRHAASSMTAVLASAQGYDEKASRRIVAELEEVMAFHIRHWTDDLDPISFEVLDEATRKLAAAEPFVASLRVAREQRLFTLEGKPTRRLLRRLRRLRRWVLGPGTRVVPSGRLWRGNVALELPRLLWNGVSPGEAQLWMQLTEHYRLVSADVRRLSGVPLPADETPSRRISLVESAAIRVADPPPPDLLDPQEREDAWEEARARAVEREVALAKSIEEVDAAYVEAFSSALAAAWRRFLDAVAVAGTLEYPSWRYRTSRRYDVAQAALAQLRDRMGQDANLASGIRGEMIAVGHSGRVAAWAVTSARHFSEGLAAGIGETVAGVDRARELCAALRASAASTSGGRAAEPGEGSPDLVVVGEQLTAEIGLALKRLERVLNKLAGDDLLRHPRHEARRLLLEVPETIELLDSALPGESLREVKRAANAIPLRSWLRHALVRELTVVLMNTEESLGETLGRARMALEHALQVLAYHMAEVAHVTGDDEGLGDRVDGLLERAGLDLEEATERVHERLYARITERVDETMAPIRERRWAQLRRRLRQFEGDRASRAVVQPWLRGLVGAARREGRRAIEGVATELRLLLAEGGAPEEITAWRNLVFGPKSTMPDAYRRLFTSVPAEAFDLLVERPETGKLTRAAAAYLEGTGGPVLISGHRGAGKRTIVRQVAAELRDRLDVHWLRLTPHVQHEPEVARELAGLLGHDRFPQFSRLAQAIVAAPPPGRPQCVVVENVERMFRRTHAGLDELRRFLELVAATRHRVLYVVLVAEPALRLLDPMLEMRARFATEIAVGPMSPALLEAAISARHRFSGYSLEVEGYRPALHEWVHAPRLAWTTVRRPSSAVFEKLRQLSGGNVRQALRLWLAAARIDPATPSKVVVGPLAAMSAPLLGDLPLSSRLLLAALVVHGPLQRSELEALQVRSALDLGAELARLAQLGLVVVEAPTFVTAHGEPDPLVSCPTRTIEPLTAELRACNLL